MKVLFATNFRLSLIVLFIFIVNDSFCLKVHSQSCGFLPGGFYVVTSNEDFSPGSLRNVIEHINTENIGGTLIFQLPTDEVQIMVPLPVCNVNISILGINTLTNNQIIINGNYQQPPVLKLTPASCFENLQFKNLPLNYTVLNTNDSGEGSLREGLKIAQQASNSIVEFNITGTPPHTIDLVSPLPKIYFGTSISGSSQPSNGYSGIYPKIRIISGQLLDYGLDVVGDNCAITGLTVSSFREAGISVTNVRNTYISGNYIVNNKNAPYGGKGLNLYNDSNTLISYNTLSDNTTGLMSASSKNLKIQNNKIGTNITGDTIFGNSYYGVLCVSSDVIVGGSTVYENIISGNGAADEYTAGIFTTSSNLVIKGNKIGTDKTGEFSIPNTNGILNNGGGNFIIGNKDNEYEKNIISGNKHSACYFKSINSSLVLEGNYIGTNKLGTKPIANGFGIYLIWFEYIKLLSLSNNLISGNNGVAILLDGSLTYKMPDRIIIKNNIIGLNAAKTDSIPNKGVGISAYQFNFSNFLIENNTISANKLSGIQLYQCDSILIRSNRIGLPFKNESNAILLQKSSNCKIGGTVVMPNGVTYTYPNTLANSRENGINIIGGNQNLVSCNSIFGNSLKGIALSNAANDSISKPIILSISSGIINGKARKKAKIELYKNVEVDNNSQGKEYITSVYTDTSGNWISPKITNPCNVVCLAIDSLNNTSEFSNLHKLNITVDANKDTFNICQNSSVTLHVADTAIHYTWYNSKDTIVQMGNSAIFSQAGKYYVTGTDDCSSATDTFWVKTLPTYEISRNISFCEGDSLYAEGKYRKISGIYVDTLISSLGCDSIAVTHLTVNQSYYKTDSVNLCKGESYKGYTESGTYTENYKTNMGCDSIVITTLTKTFIDTTVLLSNETLIAKMDGIVYQWKYANTGNIIPSENYQSFKPTSNGSFYVVLSANNCTDSSAIYYITTTSLPKENCGQFFIYPNPTNGFVTIEMEDGPIELLDLYDITGKLVLSKIPSKSKTSVNLAEVNNGIYYLRVRTPKGTYSKIILVK